MTAARRATRDSERCTPDDAASIFVRPVDGVPLDLTGAITADWREGDVW